MTLDREYLVDKNVTVLGLGIEGVDLVRYLTSHGASVTVSDAKPAEALSAQIAELGDLSVQYSLGENRVEDIAATDLLFVSQGVPLTLPAVKAAREAGVPISSMTKLFLERCPGKLVGITGSSGKTTTTTLVAAMFAAAGRKHVVGGNIGAGLLGLLECITPETWVVLELSHSQLETAERSPHIACVLNVTPNHLDRYSWEEYAALRLSEADTRSYLIDPVLRILGYEGVDHLRREVPVPATKEFIDYELLIDGEPQAIVEAKALRQQLSDRHAGQCVQYASILGVRWSLITNGTTWALYDAHARGPLVEKRVAEVTIKDERSAEEAWAMLSLFSREAFAQPSPLANLLVDRVVADELGDPDSAAVKALQRAVRSRFDERVSGGAVVRAIQRRMSGVGEADPTPAAAGPSEEAATPEHLLNCMDGGSSGSGTVNEERRSGGF
ncbi:MAG: type I restriction enzyme HsdR N-terminal domain-containing protein [Chloroflexi bacterium]|nr:type I restriction enzyme HsdR N-terminal domain-containing protein [Chloroflexota bacterium]